MLAVHLLACMNTGTKLQFCIKVNWINGTVHFLYYLFLHLILNDKYNHQQFPYLDKYATSSV